MFVNSWSLDLKFSWNFKFNPNLECHWNMQGVKNPSVTYSEHRKLCYKYLNGEWWDIENVYQIECNHKKERLNELTEGNVCTYFIVYWPHLATLTLME